ncbi:hypothetical protein QGM71_01125 [Virgibacillus sp. C22-A2]|uniref:Phage protein n=1 Tax=Virgibacillus tibetensis TaxID=3042313 RepID=A0ABU6KBA6_9BACI|nr:hypothetical protein [Virgibacillus sp. C22-A2]
MNEWLTTGEMIDQLKVGEVAEVANNPSEHFKTKDEKVTYDEGVLVWKKDGLKFFVNDYITELKWRILPNCVSFEEAMKALKEGKVIRWFSLDGGDSSKLYPREYDDTDILADFSLMDLFEGKWTIENV